MDRSGWSDEIPELHEGGHEGHAITRASIDIVIDSICRHGKPDGDMLEIGACFGHTLQRMIAALPDAKISASDTQPKTIDSLRKTYSVPVLELDIIKNDLPDACFDVVVALNVLEHIEDHETATREIARVLRPGGIFICEVPAGPGLYDGFDALLMHYRRYSRRMLSEVITKANLAIVERSAIGFIAYPAFWIAKKINRLRYGTSPNKAVVERTLRQASDGAILNAFFAVERPLRSLMSFPFGIRHTVVARKNR